MYKLKEFGLTDLNFFIIFSLFLSIFHSLIEEIYWRLFINKGLMIKIKLKYVIIISSIVFSFHHFVLLLEYFAVHIVLLCCIAISLGGFIWSLIYKKTNSIIGSWISHFIVDAAIMFIAFLLVF